MPLCFSLVTWTIKPESAEAQCPEADAAIAKEFHNMLSKHLRDEDVVHSHNDLLKNKNISEAMLGRAFMIFSGNGEELGEDLNTWKG